ncbi:MATE family efflux transporter [Halococcus hamelinensis]|uniref:MATE family efflux transporter n=2 Tax=Halococcus hamelinensis TaxID=332168 RepID=UPI003083F0DE
MTFQRRSVLDLSSEEITQGSLTRALVVLATPLLVQNLVQVVQQVVDLFFLGRLSSAAVAAVGLSLPVLALCFALVITLPFVGTQILVSQRVGGEDVSGARRAAATGLGVAVALGVVGGLVLWVGARPLVDLLTRVQPGGANVTALATVYLSVLAVGLPAAAASDAIEAAFVGWGDSRAPLYVSVATVATNLVLDPVLIFGLGPAPALGVEGAALATVAGYVAGFLLAAGLALAGRDGWVYTRATARFEADDLRELFDVGAPIAGQGAVRQVVRVLIVTVAFAAGGTAGLAAYSIGGRVASVAFVPALGLQQAAQSVVGQNLGAAKPDRAERATYLGVGLAAGGLAVIGAVQWLFPVPVATLFAPAFTDRALSLSVSYLEILAYGYPAIGVAYLFEAGFNGARRTRTSLVATLAQFWVVRLPLAAGAGVVLGAGVVAVFWAVTISNLVVAVGLWFYYRREVGDGMLQRASERAST